MKTALSVLLGLAFCFKASATVRYFHWDKPHHGDRGNVTALDLSTGKVIWEASGGKSVNFVREIASGVLLGNDEGEVVLLDKTNGKVIWRCRLEKKAEIKTLIAETDEGFFVSSGTVSTGWSAGTGNFSSAATTVVPFRSGSIDEQGLGAGLNHPSTVRLAPAEARRSGVGESSRFALRLYCAE